MSKADFIVENIMQGVYHVPIIHGKTKEYRFNPERRWRADYHLPEKKILIEIEGKIYQNGRHTRGSGYQKDLEKYRSANILGYTLLRYSTHEIEKTNGQCLIDDLNQIMLEKS